MCVFLINTCPCIVPEKKPSSVTWASTAQGRRGGRDGGGCGGTVFVTLGVFVDFGVKDSLVFAILSSAGFTLWGKPPLLSFHSKFRPLKLRPLARSFACYSVFALSCMASALLAATRKDLSESCHDNFCLHLMSETRGDWSNIHVHQCLCMCVCVSISVWESTGCGKSPQLKK